MEQCRGGEDFFIIMHTLAVGHKVYSLHLIPRLKIHGAMPLLPSIGTSDAGHLWLGQSSSTNRVLLTFNKYLL
jgi:hypothetical protein